MLSLMFLDLMIGNFLYGTLTNFSLYCFFVKDSLGLSLEEICKIVPAGCLVFFPSYKLMDKLSSRWKETGQWSRLNAQKSLFVGKNMLLLAVVNHVI